MQALARALSTKSNLLILDDVFSALDRNTRWRVATMLFKRNPETERTIIYTTHDGNIFHHFQISSELDILKAIRLI